MKTPSPNTSIDDAIFKATSAATLSDSTLDDIERRFNAEGFVILEFDPRPDPEENLLCLAPLLGHVVPHNRSNRYGILSVNAAAPKPGFIDSSNQAHPPHTDGAFKDNPEKVIALQCIVPAESGGTSFLGSGKSAHAELVSMFGNDICHLYDPEAITIQRNEDKSTKSVFRWQDGRVSMSLRMDDAAQIEVKPSAQASFDALKTLLQRNLIRFDLKPHQILIVDNLSMAHGRDSFPQNSKRSYKRLNFDGRGLLNLECGFETDFNMISLEEAS